MQLVATRLIVADNLTVSSTGDNEITVRWNAPGDVLVDNWSVRCYSDNGYEEKVTVTDTEAVFLGIDPDASYTVEVVAAGMTQPARTSITANPIRISQITADASLPHSLSISWEHSGGDPEDGWLVIYTVDGSGKSVVKCRQNKAEISPKIPGAKYVLTIQSADGTSVLDGVYMYTCPEAEAFNQFEFPSDTLQTKLLKTPEQTRWRAENIAADAFTDTFTLGDSISLALFNSKTFFLPGTEVEVLYVIRDAYGNVLPDYVVSEKVFWKNIWQGGDTKNGELTVPKVPASAGNYSLSLFVEGMKLAELPFTIQ